MVNKEAFFALVRAGLWGKVNGNQNQNENLFEGLDWEGVQKLAEEQSVVGLVTAGIQNLGIQIPLVQKLKFAGQCQLIEERNVALNHFIGEMVAKMKDAGISTLLVKGQGLAHCYDKPLWRCSGDVDLFLEETNYLNAKAFLLPLSSSHRPERRYSKHQSMTIDSWSVEIHGTMRSGLSARIDKEIDAVQKDTFESCRFRLWRNGDTDVLLSESNNDLFFVFTHFIGHFYKEKMKIRQLCDWCRLMWTYRGEVDSQLVEHRLQRAGLIKEWKTFAALAVDVLGMPTVAMPLYEDDVRWHKKGRKALEYILQNCKPNKVKDTMAIARVFPKNTLCALPSIFLNVNRLKVKERLLGR